MKKKLITAFWISITFFTPRLNAQIEGEFFDNRDSQVYKTVTYTFDSGELEQFEMTWMAENLNYVVEGSYCRNDSIENCEIYGRLYTWPAAVKACPQGWHLPPNEDWLKLVNLYCGMSEAGRHLKSKSNLWKHQGRGSNKSKFNAMPYGTGIQSTGYMQFGGNAIFWSADEHSKESAWDWILFCRWEKILSSNGHKRTTGNSVRCVKD